MSPEDKAKTIIKYGGDCWAVQCSGGCPVSKYCGDNTTHSFRERVIEAQKYLVNKLCEQNGR